MNTSFRGRIDDLLESQMTRKQFLVYMGGLLLAVVGITSLLDKLLNPSQLHRRPLTDQRHYGRSPYGGMASLQRRPAIRQL